MKPTTTDKDRAALVKEWRQSGLTQRDFCSGKKISDRTFRAWLARSQSGTGVEGHVRRAVDQAISRLEGVRALLEAGENQ